MPGSGSSTIWNVVFGVWLALVTIALVWVALSLSGRAEDWSRSLNGSVVARVNTLSDAYQNHTHTVVVGAATLTTSGVPAIAWPTDPWPPADLEWP